jgi:hypothetical protein
VIASTGEQVTIGLLAMAMHAEGLKAKSFTGSQVTVLTDSTFTKARILKIDETRIRKAWPKATSSSSPAFRAPMNTAISPRWAAAARTPRPLRWPPH